MSQRHIGNKEFKSPLLYPINISYPEQNVEIPCEKNVCTKAMEIEMHSQKRLKAIYEKKFHFTIKK